MNIKQKWVDWCSKKTNMESRCAILTTRKKSIGPAPSGEYLSINAATKVFAVNKIYPIEEEKMLIPN